MLWKLLITFSIVFTFCSAQLLDTFDPVWENTHYIRSIDLKKGYVVETDLIQIKNIDDKPQDEYYFLVNDGFGSIGNLSLFIPMINGQPLEVGLEEIAPSQVYKLKLPVPIAPNSDIELKILYIYIDSLVPVPSKISMDATQQLLYKTNKFPYSAYLTKEYTLSLAGMSKGQEMELHLDVEPSENVPEIQPRVDNQTLKYGPIAEDILPFTLKPMGLMYDHNRPLAKVVNLNRSIWLPASDINKVSIEEYYELTNTGAELDKGFSRIDWMKGRYESTRNHWALSHLEFPLLDRDLDDYYYTDKVGVVSTHKIIKNHLLLQPRYPLFGTWNYNFTLGWSEELSKFVHQLHNSSDEYIIKFPLVNSLNDVTYGDVYLEFYLPENADFESISSQIPYESISIDNELSYFDVSKGHTKVTVHYKNFVDSFHKFDIYVRYKYTKSAFYYKVGKISGFVFLGLISYYLLGLLDLSI
ncbi:OST1 Dolichyl-diphosphooligosaccharide--protein glycosyltransferase subunit 1 [Candida maltosa Xu316]|uniref:Dolichyl-diphosphooligosaccharide--protein glycosyltransferase subunit 1 n=1 Tax=Candida maltosa (strain Xu316) TaxID=1245528 RepID=M3JSY0_CANMX|nr:Dolichyl-diphosphooligosaccharide-protein glycosyltransferase subunit, putative [Candida maltosa Xu316]